MMRCDENGVPCVVQSMEYINDLFLGSILFELYDGTIDWIFSPTDNTEPTLDEWCNIENQITRQFFADKAAEKFDRLTGDK